MIIERSVFNSLTVERERYESIVEEKAKRKVMREMRDTLLLVEEEYYFVRRFPGVAPSTSIEGSVKVRTSGWLEIVA
jgi:hypothetical protein